MNILALGAHPDDVEFGCAGALIKYSGEGHKVYLMVMSLGEKGGHAQLRQKEQLDSAAIMGAEEVFWGTYRDTEIPNDRECISTIENVLREVKADMVFTSYYNDTHQDHRNMTKNVITATRYIKRVLYYETLTSVDFSPTIFIDIDGDILEKKLNSLEAHGSQILKTNIDGLSVMDIAKSLSNFQGIQARMRNAEGFVPLRYHLL